ncbi:TRAP transporter solute receptor, TAXI family protein [endosymbiont of Acanthamoeba sp. UWC8]|uniref:TAXI family TRAP transporter solute-binding subunit n=1 Tax=endosymbiont of Acanthamoeba sp. UWC8 TaxID=86106 RepID=UPI0004D0C574|nr:TAXI family TRAP transporter solute-binding subunit [endosymbiont of Acanthamoeba sp. UWC8]AIF80992.1 TRAP transporter solute receptor, TAXI family protein [endosymbiont of Acanthamoeba sp. UWC8]
MKRVVWFCFVSLFINIGTVACAQNAPTYLPPINLPGQKTDEQMNNRQNESSSPEVIIKPSGSEQPKQESITQGIRQTFSTLKNSVSKPINTPNTNIKELDKLSKIDLKKPYIDDNLITIGTGPITGVYYPAGGAICRMMNRKRNETGLRCAVESSPGSIYNLAALRNAEMDFAIVQSDWQEYAFDGTYIFEKQGPFEKLRYVLSLHNEAFTMVVRKDSKIVKLDDIQGKVVNIGNLGTGARATMEALMSIKGWSISTFKSATELKPEEQIEALCNRKIDVMVVLAGHPSGMLQDAMSMCDTKILNVDDLLVRDFVAKNYEYSMTKIPGGLYVGETEDINTFGLKALLLTTTDTSSEIVYEVTKSVFEDLSNFKKLHPVFVNLEPSAMINEGRAIPIHPGAMKYYQEKGYVK